MRRLRQIGPVLALVLAAHLSAGAELRIGLNREQTIDLLGRPDAQVQKHARETLYYGRSTAELAHGLLVRWDDDILEAAKAASERKSATPAQRSSPRTTPTQVAKANSTPTVDLGRQDASSAPAVTKLSEGGRQVDLQSLLVPGKVTIVDFYAEWCGPCRRIDPTLRKLANDDPDIFLRKVDIVRWGTDVTKQYGIRSVPNVRVFNRSGEMVGQPTPSVGKVMQFVAQAK